MFLIICQPSQFQPEDPDYTLLCLFDIHLATIYYISSMLLFIDFVVLHLFLNSGSFAREKTARGTQSPHYGGKSIIN